MIVKLLALGLAISMLAMTVGGSVWMFYLFWDIRSGNMIMDNGPYDKRLQIFENIMMGGVLGFLIFCPLLAFALDLFQYAKKMFGG